MRVYEIPETLPAVTSALKAAGEPSRLRILKALEAGELCVCHLVALLGVSQPTVSRHLSALRTAGLVAERKDGRWTHFRLAPASPFADRLLTALLVWGRDDPVVIADRERAREFRRVPVSEFCHSRREGEG
jgi:arsenate reductase/ArsR family transcriptional regulator